MFIKANIKIIAPISDTCTCGSGMGQRPQTETVLA